MTIARTLLAVASPVAIFAALLLAGLGAAAFWIALVAALACGVWVTRTLAEERRGIAQRLASDAQLQRREAEAERDRLAMIVAELGDAILIVDAAERIRLANPAAERLLAASPLPGRRAVEVLRDHEILDALTRARAGAEATVQVERGEPQRLLRAVARRLPGGDLLLAIQDLSALRRLETVRADFVTNVSHELRTPIASLKAMAETLRGGAIDDPEAARDFVARMLEEIQGLAQLVEQLLSLARIESRAEPLALADVDPATLLRETVRRLTPLAARAGVSLELQLAGAPPVVRADGDRVGQVLANLVHNAVKFTPAGGHVILEARDAADGVRFAVRDDGVGIDPHELGRVFERFYKGDRSRATGGTGLGLAIAKHIVQAHGGEIEAASAGAGRGATFSFTLPRAR